MNSPALLIQSLQNPALFSHKIKGFKLIETHISWVLLTGQYAYKIKKPINLGFLDFSSLEKRRHYCYEELRLNTRLAADIYLEVIAIKGSASQPTITGLGTAFEYAIKMRQFDPDKTFDQLLTQKQLTTAHLKHTAHIIAAFHNRIDSTTKNSPFGNADVIMQAVRENFSQIEQLIHTDHAELLKQLALWSEQHYKLLQKTFRQRKQTGYVRECHGDLHLGNIALIADQVTPFDGIEFNPSLYWIDVINDIAFLVMDLQSKQRDDLAFQFLNSYLQDSGDYQGLQLLRFYLVYRAMVRAKVSAIRARQSPASNEYQHAIEQYQDYVQLACHYTQKQTSLIIIMHGVSGSGKSWLSEQMINRYPLIRIRSDVERKRLHGLSSQQKSHSNIASGLYNQKSTDITYQHLSKLADDILNAGYSPLVDATFLQQQQRQLFLQQAKKRHIPFLIIHTEANKSLLLQRIRERTAQADNVSEANSSVLENQFHHRQILSNEEQKYSLTVETNNPTHLTRLWTYLDEHFAC